MNMELYFGGYRQSHFNMPGISIKVLKILPGMHQINNNEKIAVICKNFSSFGNVLQYFACLEN